MHVLASAHSKLPRKLEEKWSGSYSRKIENIKQFEKITYKKKKII